MSHRSPDPSSPGRGLAARLLSLLAILAVPAALSLISTPAAMAAEVNCAAAANPIVCENAQPGTPPSEWQVSDVGSSDIQGYATSMGVNVGETESFKINTTVSAYHINILRLGYYGGDGARTIATSIPLTVQPPQKQPACLTNSTTGLIDCGNWAVSASWKVPTTAVSGVYIALLVSSQGESQIPFVVRNDASHSEILLQTSDATWQAYNDYGGNSLYTCTVDCPPGEPEAYKAAYAVSYNRPFDGSFATDGGSSYLYYAEYQMMYWLEEEGYNVSYTNQSNVEQNGALLKNHKVFMSSGHDEYWSQGQRANVESALAAGVNLAFFSGNELFWKTRWAPSTEGTSTPDRTLITYKETHFNAPVDPNDPPDWTGSWRDPRFKAAPEGGSPENALSGQYFLINAGTSELTVPFQYSKLRMWRNTAVSKLTAGQTLTLAPGTGTLGYEWDEDVDNGFRPAGEFDMSSTTVSGAQIFDDYGSNLTTGTATHHLTLYRAPSGALVFGAGTVQWSWGLADVNAWESFTTEPAEKPADPNMEQATVNLLAEMDAQPGTLSSGLVPATASTNTSSPTSAITSPSAGANLQDGSLVTISGTATETGSGVVAGVEVSTNGGANWHPATLTSPASANVTWSYEWVAHGNPTANIKSRAVNDSANLEKPSAGITVNVGCPCSIWGSGVTPTNVDSGDASSIEVGVKFTSEVAGQVSGIRFYKAATNTGTHVGDLWSASGTLLASATFTTETASGWQQVNFSAPVLIAANTTYVAGYFAPKGHYSADPYYFFVPTASGRPSILNSPPLHAVQASSTSTNGLYSYASSPTFPTSTFNDSNYWVDPVFTPLTAPGQVTGVSATASTGSAILSWSAPSSGGLVSTYTITPYIGETAQAVTKITGTPPATGTTISGLTPGKAYTFKVQASNSVGSGPISSASNSVTPSAPTAPGAPSSVSATAASNKAIVSWSEPSNGGSAITAYKVTPYIGSSAQTPVSVSGSTTTATVSGLTDGTSYTFTVAATNEIGTGGATSSNAVTPQDTIFELATPTIVDAGDPSSVELGVKFSSSVAGSVTGIRFYKAATNTGTHVGSLWTASGSLLASGTFTNETASGWQLLTFSTPIAINPNTTYVAAYFAPNGHYSAAGSAFSSGAIENSPLKALANGTSPNGVYNYSSSSSFPTNSYNSTNYYVDVTFLPAPPPPVPGAPGAVQASPATAQALVSWTAPTNEGPPISGYTVTPYIGTSAQASVNVGASATSATIAGLQNGSSYTFKVTATSSAGTSSPSAPSNAVTPEDTIFDFAVPTVIDTGDTSSLELGVKFTSSTNGSVTGVRFYKAPANTGTHIGSLWSAEGTLLSSATFTSETASGWQQVNFAEPVPITAGTTYVAGYFAPNGNYSATPAAFSTSGFENPPLDALANSLSVNGVYAYSATPTFPFNSYNSTNYSVDVTFAAPKASAPGAPTGVLAKPASEQALVSWTPPSGNGGSPITGYKVTPYLGSTPGTPLTVGASATSATLTGLVNGTSYTFAVAAINAIGTGLESQLSGAITPRDTIFNFATPTIVDAEDGSSVELGVKFSSSVAGSVTGIRFYKAPANTGTHIGSLWSSTGTLLGSATFTSETGSGWQQVNFAEPVSITAGTTYVAGYFAPNGNYSATPAAFSSAGVETPPLKALANSLSANGVYAYSASSTFPSNSYNATNYSVDVAFAPAP